LFVGFADAGRRADIGRRTDYVSAIGQRWQNT
jgi:hypothetical protein